MAKKKVNLRAIQPRKSTEVEYRKALMAISKSMSDFVKKEIIPLLKQEQSQYVADDLSDDLSEKLDEFKRRYFNIETLATGISTRFVNQVNQSNKQRFDAETMERLGVNVFADNQKLSLILKSKIEENTNLIVSQPQEYFKSISNSVFEGVTQGLRASEIEKNIRKATRSLDKRIKLIARDQVNKANAALNEERQKELGVTEYRWSNSGDRRVRGKSNPGGLYPNSKYDHWAREGKIYSWDDPPPDGHPGQPYGCRCVAQPVIEIET